MDSGPSEQNVPLSAVDAVPANYIPFGEDVLPNYYFMPTPPDLDRPSTRNVERGISRDTQGIEEAHDLHELASPRPAVMVHLRQLARAAIERDGAFRPSSAGRDGFLGLRGHSASFLIAVRINCLYCPVLTGQYRKGVDA